jgi:1-deoxy-D-xylulose-5-phosphate synthase
MDLKDVQSPQDLKSLSVEELQQLGQQLREKIVQHVSQKGGHLAPSLGVIELTLALHFVYNTPEDKIVWDVGHQAYAHKLITGRYNDFHSLRQYKGLSGFLKRTESPYDCFGAGHASTSISAALGFAVARDFRNEKHCAVAVIGDGSLTGGMALEAINNAAAVKENMTIVLNDNKMSIAPNVGAISKYLNKVIADPTYNKVRNEVWQMFGRLPVGDKLQKMMGHVESTAKRVLMPGRLFEDLGVRYFGPIDGHNLEDLIQIFQSVKKIPGPCLVHVITEKGRGWEKSEADSYKWHASVPFDTESGEPLKAASSKAPLTKVFAETLSELMAQDESIVAITAAMPSGTGLNIVEKQFPERVIDVGIAEQHAVTFASGMAAGGMIPVCAIYSTFMQRAFDQVIHDAALQKLHVIFALDRGGLVGADGPTHHGSFDVSYMRMIPNMVIMAPSDENELRDMLYTAVHYKKGPVTIRFPRGNARGEVKSDFESIEIGKPKVLKAGNSVLMLALGAMVAQAEVAQSLLEKQGISVTLVDARFAKPLDLNSYTNLLESHELVVTLEDNSIVGGYGSGILEFMAQLNIRKQVLTLGLPDSFVDHGEVSELYKELGLDGESIAHTVLKQTQLNNS